ncbi:MAG: hypothetical protein C4547_16855 [Phycisphaerales bacterium]|nr:MAG: hypothetical protein C4547_16855 [Phycisphaerales bacterium]
MEQIKLLTTTTILTLVIWIGADQLLTVSAKIRVRPRLVPASAESSMIVRLADGARDTLEVTVSGPRRLVADFDDVGVIDVVLPVDERPPDPNATLVNLADLLGSQGKALKNLTVDSVEPPALNVIIDQRVSRMVGLSVKRPLQLEYEVEPKLQPSQITVDTTALAYARFEGQNPTIEIDVEPDLRGKPRGEPVVLDLPVPLTRFGPNARSKVETVQVFATLKSAQKRTVTIPTVPIRLAPTILAFGRPFRAKLVGRETNLLTQTIVVTGTDEALNRLDPNNSGIYGVIPLHEADYERPGPLEPRTPAFILPAGIRLDQEAEPVRIELVPESGSSPGGMPLGGEGP